MQIWPGNPYPLGATYDGSGTNFALFSEVAEPSSCACSTSDGAGEPGRSCARSTPSSGTPTCRTSGPVSATASASPGPTTRAKGLRCNPHKLLLDPYSKAVEGEVQWDAGGLPVPVRRPEQAQQRRLGQAHAEVGRRQPVLRLGRRPRAAAGRTTSRVIYEAHVRGLTIAHPDIPEEIRGTYAAIAHPAIIEHFDQARTSPRSS